MGLTILWHTPDCSRAATSIATRLAPSAAELDATASGCCLVASDLQAVEMADANATTWVDQRHQELLIDGLDRLSWTQGAGCKRQLHKQVVRPGAGGIPSEWRGLLGI